MDQTAILTSHVGSPASSLLPLPSDVVTNLSPLLASIGGFSRIIHSLSVFLGIRAYLATTAALQIGRIAGFHALVATYWGGVMSGTLVYGAWESSSVKELRKRVFFEFAVFALGSGYTVILALFWPGWWLLAGASAAWYWWT